MAEPAIKGEPDRRGPETARRRVPFDDGHDHRHLLRAAPVVFTHWQTIKVADHIVDLGPHAGSQGGQVMYEGPFKNLLSADTLTGRYMKQSGSIKSDFRAGMGCN